jgi:ABC-type branched-subunit amino acid transport system ATPase component/branched-subunit amino acid ABC-type transport system permease component
VHEIFTFIIVGLGTGAIYGLLAQGIVLIYRSSAVISLAQGAFAMAGGIAYGEAANSWHVPLGLALIVATVLSAVIGGICYAVVIRPIANSAPLTKLIAALGILLTLQSGAALIFGTDLISVPSLLPTSPVSVFGVPVGEDRISLLAIGLVVTVSLAILYRRTSFGRATTAVAENPQSAAALGYSPYRVALLNWVLAAGVAGFAGALVVPISGLQISNVSLLVIPALAAALAAGFSSFTKAFVAAIILGSAESVVSLYIITPGWSQALPFIALVLYMVIRGRTVADRGSSYQRLPAVLTTTGKASYLVAVIACSATIVVVALCGISWVDPIYVTAAVGTIGLSVVVITGFCGQLSIAAYAIAGVGALCGARALSDLGLPFLVAILLGGLAAGVVGVIMGLPSLRTRGVTFAIITLGLGTAIENVVFNSLNWAGGVNGVEVGHLSLFGWNIDAVDFPRRYASLTVIVFLIVFLVVINLRRALSGMKMIAIRSNERAAMASGLSPSRTKLYAFFLGCVICGLGGEMLSLRYEAVNVTTYTTLGSIALLGFVVMGSVGSPWGALIGGLLATDGVVSRLVDGWFNLGANVALIGGIGVLLTMLLNPNGIAVETQRNLVAARVYLRAKLGRAPAAKEAGVEPARWDLGDVGANPLRGGETLAVRDLSVAFGGVHAVEQVSFEVRPGEVLGLIGPNGAGKTTCVDAITGFVRSSGSVKIGAEEISSMSAAARARSGVVRSFQSLELFADLTVCENLLVCEHRSWLGVIRDLIVPRRPELGAAARYAVRELGLASVLGSWPDELSFGQRRLVGIARVLASNPRVVILDEPGAGLDHEEAAELGRLVRLVASWGIAVVLIEHHLEMIFSVCDRVVVLQSGKTIAAGAPNEVSTDPSVLEAYIGSHAPVSAADGS